MKPGIIIFIISIFFLLLSCKTEMTKGISEEKINYDKYEDTYKKGEYFNKELEFKILFGEDWAIITRFKDFDSNQKKFVKYFTTENNEVLFIGANDNEKIGVRAICENLAMTNDAYLERIKRIERSNIAAYKVTTKKEEKIFLKNIEGINLVFETAINNKNVFVFDCLIFKNANRNYRLDFWMNKELYENNKEIINNIYQKIDFTNE
jgi:hypothetical protein